tara:strand:+ start:1060 stop:1770 length:711 start_codon:yes stop_codon:yes gene_type:complete
MAGLSDINRREQKRAEGRVSNAARKEIWLRDGDQVFLRSVATGEDGDAMLEELYVFALQTDSGSWQTVLADPETNRPMGNVEVPEDRRASHKFAFWAYVSDIIHSDRHRDDWEEIQSASGGRTAYRETVNDFRIMTLPFGRNNQYWNMLVDQFEDWDGLHNGVLRVKRSGTGIDTTYTVSPVSRAVTIPDERVKESTELQSIWDYFVEHYGGNDSTPDTETEVITSTESISETDDF